MLNFGERLDAFDALGHSGGDAWLVPSSHQDSCGSRITTSPGLITVTDTNVP